MAQTSMAVIIAAGKSERCHPLTLTRPKPLLQAGGATLIEHLLGQLTGLVKKAVIVTGYREEMLKNLLGKEFGSVSLRYVTQKEQLGTAHAVSSAKELLDERFLVLNADDLYARADLRVLLAKGRGILTAEHSHPERFASVSSEGGILKGIVEKPKDAASKVVNIGAYHLDKGVLPYLGKTKLSPRGEYELTGALNDYCREFEMKVSPIAQYWLPVGYPWDLLTANEVLLDGMRRRVSGTIESGAHVKGTLVLGPGSVVKSGTYIEGPVYIGKGCIIGPNAYLRDHVCIHDGCKVGAGVELKNTILFTGARVPHLSYVGDSVIGENANLGAGTITGNLRHDNANVQSAVKGQLVDTARRKFGTIVGDNVKTGIDTMIYPGRKFWPGTSTAPGTAVTKDVM